MCPQIAICLLGNYADAGLRVAHLLHEKIHGRILLIERGGQQAETVTLCVNLTEATPPTLVAALVANGTHFIDSSGSADPTHHRRA